MNTIPSGIELAFKWLVAVVHACVATTETETASVAEGAATVVALKKQPTTVPNTANWFLMAAPALRVFTSNRPDKPFSRLSIYPRLLSNDFILHLSYSYCSSNKPPL
jgi:hypothetical protein